MAKPVVFVIGASGNIGTATVSSLSQKYGEQVDIRAGVRNPEKADKLKELPNVSVVKAEMGSTDLVTALAGVHSLYIVVPGTQNRTELTLHTIDSAKAAAIKHLVVLSVATAEATGTVFGDQFTPIEKCTKESGIPYTLLRLPIFIDNNWAFKDTVQGHGAFYGPAEPDKSFTPVAASDAGKAAAVILSDPEKHSGNTYNIVSDRYSNNDLATVFTEALGKEVKYIQVPFDQAKKSFIDLGFPEWQTDGVLELFKLMNADSPWTNQANLSDFETITGEKPTSVKDWLKSVAGAFK